MIRPRRISFILASALVPAIATGLASCTDAPAPDMSADGAAQIAPAASAPDLFKTQMANLTAKIDAQTKAPIVVPVPKDAGGGYTHEQHKFNAKSIYEAGALYRSTGDAKYADFAQKMLLAYADMYPGLGLHPQQKEQSPGRLFWQSLNEAWWTVYAIQGYDDVKDHFSQETRDKIETDLFDEVTKFLSEGQPQTFNKVHNHGTWAAAAVGMTGYVLGDQDRVEKALYGLDKSGTGGFMKQLDKLFSPDGYYNEGPYYQRFALMPFVLFGQAIEKNEPERKIFEHRDGILKKAIYSNIQQSYNGLFFPINDAIKDKGIATVELQYGVAIAYDLTGDTELLSVAAAQGEVVPTAQGQALARDLAAGKAQPFNYRSMRLGDGDTGDQGALDILRASKDPKGLALVVKNTSQGLGHGHFDKMGFLLYDAGHEIMSDYGAARFLNIEAKYGGHYLPENNAFAKQTISHNALVVDGKSHFDGDLDTGNANHPVLGTFHISDNLQITSAHIDTAYPDVKLTRAMAIISDPAFERPVVLDVMRADAGSVHRYDLPFYYNGHIVDSNLKIAANSTSRAPLGTQNGYQYLWNVGSGSAQGDMSQVTLIQDRTFYTLSTLTPPATKTMFAEVGANDPNFNLRRETAMILRTQARNAAFISVIEPHGEYNPILEFTKSSHSAIADISQIVDGDARLITLTTKAGAKVSIAVADDSAGDKTHAIKAGDLTREWQGQYALFGSE